MIVSKIQGGLGNQLFQYALGKMLSIKHNTPLYLDLSWFNGNTTDTKRELKLKQFHCHYKIASQNQLNFFYKNESNLFFAFIERLKDKLLSRDTIIEYSFDKVNNKIFSSSKNTYISGYWQSDIYFSDIENELRKELIINSEKIQITQNLFDQINRENSIGVHVRRGDYVSNPIYSEKFGTCSLKYYNEALLYINNHVKNPIFYIFSDDIKWCEENLKIDQEHSFVQSKSDIEDFYLLSKCKHQIIANSSFSWWAAWLNDNKRKIVIAPKQWLLNSNRNQENPRLPSNWIKL